MQAAAAAVLEPLRSTMQNVARGPANRHVIQGAMLMGLVLSTAAPLLLIKAGSTGRDAVLRLYQDQASLRCKLAHEGPAKTLITYKQTSIQNHPGYSQGQSSQQDALQTAQGHSEWCHVAVGLRPYLAGSATPHDSCVGGGRGCHRKWVLEG